jgi:hypothetical protein
MLGDLTKTDVSIAHISLGTDRAAAYAAYVGSKGATQTLTRILVINFNAYNTTVDGAGLDPVANAPSRPNSTFSFDVGAAAKGASLQVQRLWANGSDAITGITWDGWSYNYELDHGRPVRLANVTVGETAVVGADGKVSVVVPDSSAVLLSLVKPSVLYR